MNFNVNITERQLEDRLIELLPSKYNLKILKRQFDIGGGVIDILAKSLDEDNLYLVIEVKVGDITPDSVCQVLRYTQYLNSEYSKDCKRTFAPLLIGNGLSMDKSNGHLYKLLNIFDGYIDNTFYCHYTLFKVGINGIELGWYNIENKNFIENKYKILQNRYDYISSKKSEFQYDSYLKEKELKEHVSFIKFLKRHKDLDFNKLLEEYAVSGINNE